MSKQLLIYNTAVPVSRDTHGDAFIEPIPGFGFSAGVNSVPLMLVEFTHVLGDYVIVFGGTGDMLVPAVVLGMRDGENLFLADDGAWSGRYVPAFVRRYPFVFAQTGDQLTLCVDEAFAGLNRGGRGQALFDAKGEPSEYTASVLAFMQDFQA